jgi:hypothetical protein
MEGLVHLDQLDCAAADAQLQESKGLSRCEREPHEQE